MVIASDCVGFTFPGMIDEPGSFSGSIISPKPQRGPDASQRMSLAIFIRLVAKVLSAPLAKTIGSCPASAWNLFGAVTKGKPVISAIWAATFTAKIRMRVQSRPDGGATQREFMQWRQRRLDCMD